MALKPIGILTLRKDALEVPVNYDLIWSDLIWFLTKSKSRLISSPNLRCTRASIDAKCTLNSWVHLGSNLFAF